MTISFLSYLASGLKDVVNNLDIGINPSPGEAKRFLCSLRFGGELSAVEREREHRSFRLNGGKTVEK